MEIDGAERSKAAAARYAADLVEDGMVLGLGTGSTASLFVRALGERVRAGLRVIGVPTSEATAHLAVSEGIALATLEDRPHLDLDVDGADAIDPDLNLLKGLGGALLREKIVAAAARRFVIVADEGKVVTTLTGAGLVPVEIVPFGWSRTRGELEHLGAMTTRRLRAGSQEPYLTDGGHFILDCHFDDLSRPADVAARVKALTGVVDHGLFIAMASTAVVGRADGSVDVRQKG